MEFVAGFFLWIVLCVVAGYFASGRGRSGLGWGLLALLISPLVAFILIAVLPNLKAEQLASLQKAKEQQASDREASKVTGPDFMLQVENLRQLLEKHVVSDVEFKGRKAKMILDLRDRFIAETPEAFLRHLLPLLDSGALGRDEMDQIKGIVFSREHPPTQAAPPPPASFDPGI